MLRWCLGCQDQPGGCRLCPRRSRESVAGRPAEDDEGIGGPPRRLRVPRPQVLVQLPRGGAPCAVAPCSPRQGQPRQGPQPIPAQPSRGASSALDVGVAGERLRLLRAKLEAATAEAPGGTMVVHVALPAGCALGDVSLRVSEPTAKLEVRLADEGPDGTVKTFSLQDHLPQGAELSLPVGAGGLAKLFPRTDVLRVSLPCKRI
mmetsp:Transcript_1664/g.5683  ORF Transcript_1664/g.5683 Transcript_1664/m.5683 type:complete len:204 (+) Transcript_1664:890-1501(+)